MELVLVSYVDDYAKPQFQLAVVGENTVHLLEPRTTGFSNETGHQGRASKWLTDGVFAAIEKAKALLKKEKK